MLARIKASYDYEVVPFRPEPAAVEQYVAGHGLNAFYDSTELRKECCRIRKVEPLNRALAGNKAWITGQRRAQSATRTELAVQEDDAAHGMTKFNPLADWSEEAVWDYIHSHQVPYNPLHDKGFPSIGCEPCTRAIEPGEDVRAGRWWWENPDSKESINFMNKLRGENVTPSWSAETFILFCDDFYLNKHALSPLMCEIVSQKKLEKMERLKKKP